MRASITSTDQIVGIEAVEEFPAETGRSPPPTCRVMARVWEGVTESGVRFTAYIPLVQVRTNDDNSQFERELSEHKRPDPDTQRAIDMRFII